jgi:hypothetical protein
MFFTPEAIVSVSKSHSVNTITASTRFGTGGRNTPKTVASGQIDLKVDIAEINAGRATRLSGGVILTSSGRIYGVHPGISIIWAQVLCS